MILPSGDVQRQQYYHYGKARAGEVGTDKPKAILAVARRPSHSGTTATAARRSSGIPAGAPNSFDFRRISRTIDARPPRRAGAGPIHAPPENTKTAKRTDKLNLHVT